MTSGKATTSTKFSFYKIQITMVVILLRVSGGGLLDKLLSNPQTGPRKVPHVYRTSGSQRSPQLTLQKREPCVEKGARVSRVHSRFLQVAESESDFCFEAAHMVDLCGSSEKSPWQRRGGQLYKADQEICGLA